MLLPREYTVTFAFQSQDISFSDWISLFTICLAPLLAHIMSGFPEPIILTDTPPHWTERLYLWNPMAITWRYFVIVDRRIRTRDWTPRSMADVNAVFWTDAGWRGCDHLADNPGIVCTKLPGGTTIPWISSSAAKTLIVTLQAFQVVYLCVVALWYRTWQISIQGIFFAISLISLLRLPAAPWLTEEFGYSDASKSSSDGDSGGSDSPAATTPLYASSEQGLLEVAAAAATTTTTTTVPRPLLLHPQSSRRALCLRAYFLLCNLASLGLNITLWFCPGPLCPVCRSSTAFLRQIFFSSIIVPKATLFHLYILTGRTSSPILPCQSSRWYKAYMWVLVAMAAALLFVSVLETRRGQDGAWTSVPDIPSCKYKVIWDGA